MDISLINAELKKAGLNPYGDPFFRVVHSDSQYEVRVGVFEEFHGSIYLRTVRGAKEVPKYSYIHDRWVMERWFPPALAYNEELPHSNRGSYEPIYVFEDRNGNALPVRLDVCQIIVQHFEQPSRSAAAIKSAAKLHDEKKEAETLRYFEDAVDVSVIGNALRLREGVGYTAGLKGK